MNEVENAVVEHYGGAGLLARILKALDASGIDLAQLQPDDLAPVDEFHTGGRKATRYAVSKMPLDPAHHLLDVGCGIGGAARFIAAEIGCRVTGIDLTPEYIATATALTEHTHQSDKVQFKVASALDMPFADAGFDAALTIHVAMNIHDRAALYGEIARVTKSGATLCIFDMMKKSDAPLAFPLPWASTSATSHLTTPDEMRRLLDDAGFDVEDVEDRTEIALSFFKERLAAHAAAAGKPEAASPAPPPLGVNLVLGDLASEKFTNVLKNITAGRIGPVQIIARRRA